MQPTEIEVMIAQEAPRWLVRAMLHLERRVNTLNERIIQIMSMQEHLDADLLQMNADLQSVIAELKSQAGANTILDFSKLDAFAANLHTVATAGQQPTDTGGGTPTPTPTPEPAPAPTPPTEAQAATPTDSGTTPGGGPGVATVQGPFYVFTGSDPSTIDATAWTKTNLETTDTPPKPLYTFTGDTPGAGATGASADWSEFTGPTQQTEAPVTAPTNEPPTSPQGA